MNKKFICTSDKETADLLRAEGFTEIQDCSGMWKFINNRPITFSEDKQKKCTYTNTIHV